MLKNWVAMDLLWEAEGKKPRRVPGGATNPEIRKVRATVVSASPSELERPPRRRHYLPLSAAISCSATGTSG